MKKYISPKSKTAEFEHAEILNSLSLDVANYSVDGTDFDSKSRNPLNFGDEDFGFGEEE